MGVKNLCIEFNQRSNGCVLNEIERFLFFFIRFQRDKCLSNDVLCKHVVRMLSWAINCIFFAFKYLQVGDREEMLKNNG